MRAEINNLAIKASAGTGKTYRLAMRYIRLLAEGLGPDQVCAMTFSRKAAAEILDAIVENLCRGAGDEKEAKMLAANAGKPGLKKAAFLKILRALLDNLQHSHISTLDSFTISVIRAFPMELGISTDLGLMDNGGAAASLARYQILSRVFNHRLTSENVQRNFHEAFKEATFGLEESDMYKHLDDFTKEYWSSFRRLPHQEQWGNHEVIWPSGCSWLDPSIDVAATVKELRDIIESREFPHAGIAKGLFVLLEELEACEVTRPFSDKLGRHKVFKALLAVPNLRKSRKVTIHYQKEFELGADECRLWGTLMERCLGIELGKKLRQTAGIGRVLAEYAVLYEQSMRNGQMTFEDAQYLLTSENELSRGSLVSRDPAARLYIDYRLNCRLDHWLLDEFQDTSNLQWEVISNLVSEVMMDDSGRKGLFMVGDVKQAIHGWRGGNAKLFGKVLGDYSTTIEEEDLDESYRSCQPVLDMVNQVFKELPETVSAETRNRWSGLWSEHKVAEGLDPGPGYCTMLQAIPTGEKGECLSEDRYRVVGQLLREIDPVGRGLSVAILVRSNKGGQELVDQLRGECPGIPICHEGAASICDNPVVAVLLSLVKAAAHPGNTMAYKHLLMSPLRTYIESEGLDPGKLSRQVLGEIQEDGYEKTIRCWGERLQLSDDDYFGLKRIDDLAAAAAVFDQGTSQGCDDFVEFVKGHETEETGTAASVNVMTIHKAKGIGRDIVIIPDLERGSTGKVDLVLPADPKTEKVKWALMMPRQAVSDAEDTLNEVKQHVLADREFEELCVLYVALTRAKRANYVIVGPDSKSGSQAAILKSRLAKADDPEPWDFGEDPMRCLYETGDRDWHSKVSLLKPEEAQERPALPPDFHKRDSSRPRLMRREPSRLRAPVRSAAGLFDREDTDVMEFGSAIHELFEKVKWSEDADAQEIIDSWKPKSSYEKSVLDDVVPQFIACMRSDAVHECLSKPEGRVDDPWIEKRFDVVLGGELVSGAFDRVIVTRDEQDNATHAVIIDYKSSRVDEEFQIDRKAEDYRPQMTTYRSALSAILELPEDKIDLVLLFTRQAVTRRL